MTPTNERQPLAHQRGYWDGDNVPGPSLIRLNRSEQKAYFYKGEELVGVSPISTGKTTHTTPAGTYKITQKSEDHKSSLYGVIRDQATGQIVNDDADTRKHKPGPGQVFEAAPMPYFMRFNGGIGMHVGHLPGYAASHGCVRMPKEMAVKFFEASQVGTPVIVE
jgi:lipoprotein-anchoring transpeptidase ErfK/SrfK